MTEIVPIFAGLALGAMAASLRERGSKRTVALLAIVIAALTTVSTAEFRISWTYFVLDAFEVAAGASAGLAVCGFAYWARRRRVRKSA